MGFTEILTIIFVLLKVFGVISWSWWLVFLPEIIAAVFYIIVVIASVMGMNKTRKSFDKHFDKHFDKF